MTKIELQALIDTINTGGLNTALEVRTALEGFRDNSYDDVVSEDSAGTHVITTPNANFSYSVTFSKVGRLINVVGTITSNITVGSLSTSPIFSIDVAEYETSGINYSIGYNVSNGNIVSLNATSDTLSLEDTITTGETYRFSLTYNALN